MGSKRLILHASGRQRNAVINIFDLPYRIGKEFGEVLIKVGKFKK